MFALTWMTLSNGYTVLSADTEIGTVLGSGFRITDSVIRVGSFLIFSGFFGSSETISFPKSLLNSSIQGCIIFFSLIQKSTSGSESVSLNGSFLHRKESVLNFWIVFRSKNSLEIISGSSNLFSA